MIESLVLAFYILSILIFAYHRYPYTLQMFQQNRYEIPRFKQWLKTHQIIDYIDVQAAFLSIIILVFSVIQIPFLSILIEILAVGILFLLAIDYGRQIDHSKDIKPLHVTPRVKRQIMTIALIYAFFIILGMNFPLHFLIFVPYLLTRLSADVVMLISIINEPIETMIRNHYLSDAKKKLHSMNQLTTIGITGSYGKTSTKNIMYEVLSENYYTLMTPASFNTPMGITITIREHLKPMHEVFICEMGADKVGEITELMNFVHPKVGVLTSIGPQHLNTFKSLDNIIREKFEIIERLPSDGVGIINIDDENIRNHQIHNQCQIITYGIEHDAMYQASNIKYKIDGTDFDVSINGSSDIYHFHTRLLGRHNVSNILAAIALGHHMGIDMKQLMIAVSKVPYIEHRLEVKKQGNLTILDNAFNSNPVGSKISLEVIKMMPSQRIVMTPGMIDLGEKQDEYNYQFGTYMKDSVDDIVLVGRIQTKKIYQGIEDSGFDMNHVYVVDTVQEGFQLVYQIVNKQAVLLIENDLPDAFNE